LGRRPSHPLVRRFVLVTLVAFILVLEILLKDREAVIVGRNPRVVFHFGRRFFCFNGSLGFITGFVDLFGYDAGLIITLASTRMGMCARTAMAMASEGRESTSISFPSFRSKVFRKRYHP
jgi:hypothetical protein